MCNIILKLQTYLIPLQLNTGVNGFANETFTFVGTDFLISVSNFMGEVILIYCCWLLWSKNYVIIILLSLTAIAGLGKAY